LSELGAACDGRTAVPRQRDGWQVHLSYLTLSSALSDLSSRCRIPSRALQTKAETLEVPPPLQNLCTGANSRSPLPLHRMPFELLYAIYGLDLSFGTSVFRNLGEGFSGLFTLAQLSHDHFFHSTSICSTTFPLDSTSISFNLAATLLNSTLHVGPRSVR
jgi:hypothetical protein